MLRWSVFKATRRVEGGAIDRFERVSLASRHTHTHVAGKNEDEAVAQSPILSPLQLACLLACSLTGRLLLLLLFLVTL